MAVSVNLGATECGKSYYVSKSILPQWQKFVIFDPTGNFQGADKVFRAPRNEFDMQKIFRELVKRDSFRALIVPDRKSSLNDLCDYSIILALSLGRTIGHAVDPDKRLQLVIDEAHQVTSSNFMSKNLSRAIFMGRHDNVDTHIISQNPMSINPKIRSMCSKVTSFFLNNASEVSFLKSCFGPQWCKKIELLPKYCRAEWSQNGEMFIFDQNNKIVEKKLKNDALFASKG